MGSIHEKVEVEKSRCTVPLSTTFTTILPDLQLGNFLDAQQGDLLLRQQVPAATSQLLTSCPAAAGQLSTSRPAVDQLRLLPQQLRLPHQQGPQRAGHPTTKHALYSEEEKKNPLNTVCNEDNTSSLLYIYVYIRYSF